MNRRRRDDLPEINSVLEIPAFTSEAEEAQFWDSHALGPGLLAKMERKTPLAKAIGPIPLGLVAALPADTLQARSERLATEIAMVEELADVAEARVLRWMRDEHERAPSWLLRQLDDLDAQLDCLEAEQEAIAVELRRRADATVERE